MKTIFYLVGDRYFTKNISFSRKLFMNFAEHFKQHISKFSTSPILFLGSGFSRRYLGLPTWRDLLVQACDDLDLPRPYDYYKSNGSSDLPTVASLMGDDFNDIWWSHQKFQEGRDHFGRMAQTKHSPLKYEIARIINARTTPLSDPLVEK